MLAALGFAGLVDCAGSLARASQSFTPVMTGDTASSAWSHAGVFGAIGNLATRTWTLITQHSLFGTPITGPFDMWWVNPNPAVPWTPISTLLAIALGLGLLVGALLLVATFRGGIEEDSQSVTPQGSKQAISS
jgi:hypothetical protein